MVRAKEDVLRYLGRRGQPVPPEVDALVEDCISLMHTAATPRHTRAVFALVPVSGGLCLDGTAVILRGGDIVRHLDGCGQVIVFAATLGTAADALIRTWERLDLTRALVLDACAAQSIEQYCDELERQITHEAAASGRSITTRFSPGYGDLPLAVQPDLLAVTDAERRIGLTCTAQYLLLPRKSVTALIGRKETR